jgi:hypothetical protein
MHGFWVVFLTLLLLVDVFLSSSIPVKKFHIESPFSASLFLFRYQKATTIWG